MPNDPEGLFQRCVSLSFIRRSSKGSRVAPLTFDRSSAFVPPWLYVRRQRSSCSSCPGHCDKSRICRLSPQQGSMHCGVRSRLLGLERRALGRHPQCGARLFPSLYLDRDVVHRLFSSSSQCPSHQLSNTQGAFWIIASFYCSIRHCDSSCGSSSDDLFLSPILSVMSSRSYSQPSRIFVPPSFSTEWATLEAPVFQLMLKYGSLTSSYCQFAFLEVPSPDFHLLLFLFNTVPMLRQLIPLLTLHLLLLGFLLFHSCCLPPFASRQLIKGLLAIVEPLEYGLQHIYIDAHINLGRVTDLLHSPPKATLLNFSVFIGSVHIVMRAIPLLPFFFPGGDIWAFPSRPNFGTYRWSRSSI